MNDDQGVVLELPPGKVVPTWVIIAGGLMVFFWGFVTGAVWVFTVVLNAG